MRQVDELFRLLHRPQSCSPGVHLQLAFEARLVTTHPLSPIHPRRGHTQNLVRAHSTGGVAAQRIGAAIRVDTLIKLNRIDARSTALEGSLPGTRLRRVCRHLLQIAAVGGHLEGLEAADVGARVVPDVALRGGAAAVGVREHFHDVGAGGGGEGDGGGDEGVELHFGWFGLLVVKKIGFEVVEEGDDGSCVIVD